MTSGTEDICAWLTSIKKGEDDLLRMMRAKKIKGEDIERIMDVFAPLIAGLKRKDENVVEREKERELPPGWKEVTSPAGKSFFRNTMTGAERADAPEMCVSDMPFSDFFVNPSALGILESMPQDFYEPLDEAFESAGFEDLENIKKKSQEKANELAMNGTLGSLDMNMEEAEVLFSYTYQAQKGKKSPCYIMNTVLAERNVNQLQNHRCYILHLLKALRKLKRVDTNGGRTILYRGIDGKTMSFDEKHYQVGNTLTWPAFTSTALEEETAYKFMQRAAQPVIFEIRGKFVGYSIKAFSRFPKEEEILLEPETTFKVRSIRNDMRNPKAKRIVVEVQPTSLIIEIAVENFKRAEWNMYHPQQKMPYIQGLIQNQNQDNAQQQQEQPLQPHSPTQQQQPLQQPPLFGRNQNCMTSATSSRPQSSFSQQHSHTLPQRRTISRNNYRSVSPLIQPPNYTPPQQQLLHGTNQFFNNQRCRSVSPIIQPPSPIPQSLSTNIRPQQTFIPSQNNFQPFVPHQQPQFNPPSQSNWIQGIDPKTRFSDKGSFF